MIINKIYKDFNSFGTLTTIVDFKICSDSTLLDKLNLTYISPNELLKNIESNRIKNVVIKNCIFNKDNMQEMYTLLEGLFNIDCSVELMITKSCYIGDLVSKYNKLRNKNNGIGYNLKINLIIDLDDINTTTYDNFYFLTYKDNIIFKVDTIEYYLIAGFIFPIIAARCSLANVYLISDNPDIKKYMLSDNFVIKNDIKLLRSYSE
jgi:hypothetical protein